MSQAFPWISLVAGASMLAIVTRSAEPPLAWLSLLFLLHASRSAATTVDAACVWLAMYLAVSVGSRGYYPMGGAAYFALAAFMTFTLSLPFLVDRLVFSSSGRLAVLVFPMAFVAVEFVRGRLISSWGSIAYSQYGSPPVMQIAAFGGIWAVTFLLAWFASASETAWRSGLAWTAGGRPLAVFVVVAACAYTAGAVRAARASTSGPSMRVAAVNRPLDLFAPGEMTRISEGRITPENRGLFEAKLRRLHDWFLDSTRREAKAGAQLVVWPEQNLLVFKDDEAAFLDRAKRLAADEHVHIAIGMGTIYVGEPRPFENKLVLVDSDGRVAMSYVKRHPVMGWEAGIIRAGTGDVQVSPSAAGRIAGAICFDADYPEFIREAGRGRTDVFVLPTNEWRAIKDVHLQMHVFRAIENGMPIVRAAASGLSAAIDPWGRIVAVADHLAPGDATLVAQLPIGHVPTIYSRIGDLLAWVCVAGVVIVMARFCTRLL